MKPKQWVAKFMSWYNEIHRHSAIRFVTPGQRYRGEDVELLAKRYRVYETAKQCNPRRWSGQTHNWSPFSTAALHPENPIQSAA